MSKTWFCSDHHFGHANILNFVNNEGKIFRPFKDIDEHDEMIIKWHNELVSPSDRVYIMGDLAINKKSIPKVARLNGRKKLIKGNHDIFKLKDYLPYFDDIVSYRVYPEHGIIVSHIPVHECQLERRFKFNFHGHLHDNIVLDMKTKHPDKRYINLCLEKTNFRPVEMNDLLIKLGLKDR
jgi:calcineurin-like phosphoesterase family protein